MADKNTIGIPKFGPGRGKGLVRRPVKIAPRRKKAPLGTVIR